MRNNRNALFLPCFLDFALFFPTPRGGGRIWPKYLPLRENRKGTENIKSKFRVQHKIDPVDNLIHLYICRHFNHFPLTWISVQTVCYTTHFSSKYCKVCAVVSNTFFILYTFTCAYLTYLVIRYLCPIQWSWVQTQRWVLLGRHCDQFLGSTSAMWGKSGRWLAIEKCVRRVKLLSRWPSSHASGRIGKPCK